MSLRRKALNGGEGVVLYFCTLLYESFVQIVYELFTSYSRTTKACPMGNS